jgi:hypothetical protein
MSFLSRGDGPSSAFFNKACYMHTCGSMSLAADAACYRGHGHQPASLVREFSPARARSGVSLLLLQAVERAPCACADAQVPVEPSRGQAKSRLRRLEAVCSVLWCCACRPAFFIVMCAAAFTNLMQCLTYSVKTLLMRVHMQAYCVHRDH